MSPPVIQTTVVGSYPVPAWLSAYPSGPNLRDALLVVLKTQELAGIDVISDGELGRFDPDDPDTNGMIDYFTKRLGGIRWAVSTDDVRRFRERRGMAFRHRPSGVVTGPIDPGVLDLVTPHEQVRELTGSRVKFTVTSPYMLAKTLLDDHYGSLERLTMAIADALAEQVSGIDADVVQVDEANIPGSPHDGPVAARAINRVLAPARATGAVHVCFGNYGGQTVQKGSSYDPLVAFLDELKADHLVLEVARRSDGDLEALKDVRPDMGIGVGVIDIKDNQVESPNTVAGRIQRASDVLGDRLRWVHPDCGFWMLHRSVADAKMQSLVAGRDLFLGA